MSKSWNRDPFNFIASTEPPEKIDEIDLAVRDAIDDGLSDSITEEEYERIMGDLWSAIQNLRVASHLKDKDMWQRTIERITRYAEAWEERKQEE